MDKYKFTNPKTNQADVSTFPTLYKKDEPFTLPPEVAKAYLNQTIKGVPIITPVGKATAEEAIEELETQIREEAAHVYTESELKTKKKAELVIIAGSSGVSVVPDSETNAEIITKILAAQGE